ncbi:hypothetical protein AGMMS50255_7320 [Spirochaetia bacterium]|nr:hypothetical protein AGMMS50255_7320 [Spirochaetia bacterium]
MNRKSVFSKATLAVTLAGMLALCLAFTACPPGNGGPGAADAVVTDLNLTILVTAPVKGAAPQSTFAGNTQYTGTIAWTNNSGTAHTGAFAASTVYKAELTLRAKTGYTFTGVAANSFTYSGEATLTNAANSGIVTIVFPATQTDSVLNQSIAAYNDNASVVSRGTMPDAEKTAVVNGFTNAINGADSWYKDRISSGAFVLKLYVENDGTPGTEADGMHRTSAAAQAMTSAEITAFMISKGKEKPVIVEDTKLVNESLNGGRVVVSSSAVMSDAEKALVKSAIEYAVNGASWHLARMNAKNIVLTISVNNGGTNLSAGWAMTDAAAKSLSPTQVENWLNANVAAFQPETLQLSSGIGTATSRVPLEAGEKSSAQTKINASAQDASFAWYPAHSRTITIWIENGKTAGTETGALHTTYANLIGATNAGFAEQMADTIDGKANLNKSVPAEYIGTKATIKTGLWLTAAEWGAIKSNIEAALNAQNWWKDNVGAAQLKVDVGGTSIGYAQVSQAQVAAGTATVWPILKAFLETQTAFQSGNYSTDGWTIYYRVPMTAAQKGYIDQAIANLGWYQANGGSYKNVYVNNGPDNLSDGGNGTVISGNPANQAAVQSAIIGFLNLNGVNEPPAGPVYVDVSDPALPNLVIEHDSTLNLILADLNKIFDAYDPDGDGSVYPALRGKTIKVIIEAGGTTSVDANGVHISKAWLDNSANSYIHLRGFLESFANTYAYTKPQQQNNFKIILGNEVLASVRNGTTDHTDPHGLLF